MALAYKYFNQNDYSGTPYPSASSPKATVKTGGCGVVSAAMIIGNMTNRTVSVPKMAAYAIQRKARVPGGTDMNLLAKALCVDYTLTYIATSDESKLVAHLKNGGMAICNVGGDHGDYVGIFSNEGHFIVAAGLTSAGKIIILDPGYYVDKFNKIGRIGKVTVQGNYCICDVSVLAKDTENRSPAYWLFERKVAEVPDWKIKVIKEAESLGLLTPGIHGAEETADKAFVAAIIINLYKKLEGEK